MAKGMRYGPRWNGGSVSYTSGPNIGMPRLAGKKRSLQAKIMVNPTRRLLLTSFGALLAAPALVRAPSLMPVKAWHEDVLFKCTERHFPTSIWYPTIDAIDSSLRRIAFLKQEGKLFPADPGYIIRNDHILMQRQHLGQREYMWKRS